MNHRSVLKKCGRFLKHFLTSKIPSKPTASGNAAFYAFAELIPKLTTQMGVNPAFLTIPMLQASNLGRGLSPVSGVVVAVSGMGKISPFEIVKRMSVPMLVGFICVIIGTEIFVSVAV